MDEKFDEEIHYRPSPEVQLDSFGLPLVPQPTGSKHDPLNFPQWLKKVILITVSTLGLLGPFVHSIPNPAYVPMSEYFGISVTTASYQSTIAMIAAGISPFIWVPLSNVYGRRPILLATTLVAAMSALGAGKATTFENLMVARFFHGFFTGTAMAVGGAVVVDLFYLHERGVYFGIFACFISNGAHVSPFIGGYMSMGIGFQWCYYLSAILSGFAFLWMIFAMPETLFHRDPKVLECLDPNITFKGAIKKRMNIWGLHCYAANHITWKDFLKPFTVAKYPVVTFSAILYGVILGYASIEPALTVAGIFSERYGFNPGQNGLVLGISLLIGTTLGELLAGPIADINLRKAREKSVDGHVEPEERLKGIFPGAILMPAGLLIYGFTIEYNVHWIAPCIAIAVASFGMQIIASVLYIYTSDSYKSRTGDVSQLFNFSRQLFGFTLGFYSLPLGHAIGFQFSFIVYTAVFVIAFLPILYLMKYGSKHRR